jgi:hypothetical protein
MTSSSGACATARSRPSSTNSLRTVEHYVSRAFDKLGVRSRVELARRLDELIENTAGS